MLFNDPSDDQSLGRKSIAVGAVEFSINGDFTLA